MESIQDFLERAGPNQSIDLQVDITQYIRSGTPYYDVPIPPRIELYCKVCCGTRGFNTGREQIEVEGQSISDEFIYYSCKDCERDGKGYAVRISHVSGQTFRFIKYGEQPPFAPQYDPRVGELLGADEHYYRKGLDCEGLGMGIGAFAYYRRVLENQRVALFDRVINVAERLGAPIELMEGLRKAGVDGQFTKAIETIKAGPLQAIYVNGHNPLTLLYDAVSDGLHRQSDEDNMETAQTIRLLLGDLARRLDELMADHNEVESAVNRLLTKQAQRRQSKSEANKS